MSEIKPEDNMKEEKTKLIDNLVVNQTKWPEIFGLSEAEVLEIFEAYKEYALVENSQSYKDWCAMYNGIHTEWNQEMCRRNWLACARWIKSKRSERIYTESEVKELVETFFYEGWRAREHYIGKKTDLEFPKRWLKQLLEQYLSKQ